MAKLIVSIKCENLEPVKKVMDLWVAFSKDERISEEIRIEYMDKINKVLEDKNDE